MKRLIKKYLSLKMPKGNDRAIHATVIIFMFCGSLMVVSAMTPEGPTAVVNTIVRQVGFVIISYIAMCFFARNYILWMKNSNFERMLFIVGVVIIGLLLSTQLFREVNGSRAWIQTPVGTIQPSEFAKIYLIVLCGYNSHRLIKNNRISLFQYMTLPGIFYIVSCGIILILQNDLGTALVLSGIFFVASLIPSNLGIRKQQRILVLVVVALASVVFFFAFTKIGLGMLEGVLGSYRLKRFTNAANPFKDLYGTGYNIAYSLFAIANGGLTGKGYSYSHYKNGYLPEAQTDFIFSVIIEETGIIGLLIVVLGYSLLLYRLFYYAKRIRVSGSRIILIGCASYLFIHFVLNIGGISGLIPLTGVPLLFMSSGGTSILSISIIIGISQAIISLYRNQFSELVEKKKREISGA